MPKPSPTPPIIDIFCRVIDNFGDIGVCWRLARQLRDEYHYHIRLWVDELDALVAIWPQTTNATCQTLDNIEVLHWHEANFAVFQMQPAQVVIEAFACEIPAPYQSLIAARKTQAPLWINLDYLSAEAWIEDCHGLVSVAPATGINKVFFFPGFTSKTGGLLREQGLLDARATWREGDLWLQQQGITLTVGARKICLFSYENASISVLLQALADSDTPTQVLVAGGKSLASVNDFLCRHELAPLADTTTNRQLGNLTLTRLPFFKQTEFDKLLWSMDINFVRGEDSLVRAIWAGAPFVWHIYLQEGNAHLEKLQAFLTRFLAASDPATASAITAFWQAWNQASLTPKHWHNLLAAQDHWATLTAQWRDQQALIDDLAAQIAHLIHTSGVR